MASLCGLTSYCVIGQVNAIQSGSPVTVKVSPERLKRIDQLIQGQIDSGLIKGAVAFVARDGKVIYNKAFGIDDDNLNTPMKTDAIFRIASQTKAITSVAVMILFEEGKFFLDDPVSKYIPAFGDVQVVDKFDKKDTSYTTKPANRLITIRDLLTHTSGIGYPLIGNDTMRAIYAKAAIPLGMVVDPMLLKEGMIKREMFWRNWWDGGSTAGPIATKYNVQSWPTIYVLDPKGVIRYKNVRGEELDKAADALLKELETGDK